MAPSRSRIPVWVLALGRPSLLPRACFIADPRAASSGQSLRRSGHERCGVALDLARHLARCKARNFGATLDFGMKLPMSYDRALPGQGSSGGIEIEIFPASGERTRKMKARQNRRKPNPSP